MPRTKKSERLISSRWKSLPLNSASDKSDFFCNSVFNLEISSSAKRSS